MNTEKIKKFINRLYVKENHMVVFDIDDTLIYTDGNPKTHIIDIYNLCLEKGLKTSIITARRGYPDTIEKTLNQLKSQKIEKFSYIYFMLQNWNDPAYYKLISRKDLTEKGFDIVCSIGDMYWDIGLYGGAGYIV